MDWVVVVVGMRATGRSGRGACAGLGAGGAARRGCTPRTAGSRRDARAKQVAAAYTNAQRCMPEVLPAASDLTVPTWRTQSRNRINRFNGWKPTDARGRGREDGRARERSGRTRGEWSGGAVSAQKGRRAGALRWAKDWRHSRRARGQAPAASHRRARPPAGTNGATSPWHVGRQAGQRGGSGRSRALPSTWASARASRSRRAS